MTNRQIVDRLVAVSDEDAPPLQLPHSHDLDPATVAFMADVDPVSAAALETAALKDTLALANRLLAKLGRR